MTTNRTFSFDIGHSSIGWAVLESPQRTRETPFPDPKITGCGSVLFPKDDCLASSRREHRRTRRNIRSTRQRIDRMKKLLLHLEVLSLEDLDATGHSFPHVLAAQALSESEPSLNWLELWNILRWYAHNRGYDGNSRWSRQEEDGDDTEKEQTALKLMEKHQTTSMAATICSELNATPESPTSSIPYKTLNAAFPRRIVRKEVLAILEKHINHLPKLDNSFIQTLISTDDTKGKQAWATIPVPDIQLPRRYFGGLLFGQLIPRFDNRIIAVCPISGKKVPNKASREFLYFRWAMLLANIKSDGKSLTAEHRQAVHALMEEKGHLTPTELRKKIESLTGSSENNIAASFEIHPDSKDALTLDPALNYFRRASNPPTKKSTGINLYWAHLPEITQYRALGRWKKGRPVTLGWMLSECERENYNFQPLENAIQTRKAKNNKTKETPDEIYQRLSFAPTPLTGRAAYARSVLKDTFDFVISTDRHPTEKPLKDLSAGPLYRSPEILKAERERPIEKLTNNHLIRQRLQILNRVTDDLITHYAENKPETVSNIIVEVARDLQEYSGLTAKEMQGELTKRLSHFKSTVTYLEKHAPDLKLNGSLIRKARIAIDMEWKCPFTGKKYDAMDLDKMEREHIIPYAERPTNALDALVLTFSWVNRLKGKRTGLQFIHDHAEDDRLFTPRQYEDFVSKIKVAKKKTYPDDFRRQSARKKWLMVQTYEVKDHGFTQGALTQTSHLNRLAARQLEKRFTNNRDKLTASIVSIPGQVTAEIRKGWKLLGTLAKACPDVLDSDGNLKTKTEIRNITHLHHALDAATLAYTHHYLPGTLPYQSENEKGKIWKAILDRNKTSEQTLLLNQTGQFQTFPKKDKDGNPELDKNGKQKYGAKLKDLSTELKNELVSRLEEQRVTQHIPADQSGAHLERNQWRVYEIQGDIDNPKTSVVLRQKTTEVKDDRRLYKHKETKEKAGKLIGLEPGKLEKNKAVLVISDNYGMALDPQPAIIPFHNVPARIAKIKADNGRTHPRILRNGMLIRVSNWEGKDGIWKIYSCKANLKLNLGTPQGTKAEWENVLVSSLLKKKGLEILKVPFTGLDAKKYFGSAG